MYLKDSTLLQGGKYKIVGHISSGGFGNTYEGVHTMMDTKVAIKEFFPKMFCNRDEITSHITVATQSNIELVDKLRKKFIEEAKAIFKMNHPNIVKVHDIFEENGTAYYVMDYIDGKSLGDIVKQRGALSESEAVDYIRQVADALKYVHSLNRLHLDIKPGNVMAEANGHAVLIDFGASKYYDMESGENTSTLMGVNTKGYAPVEQSTQSFTKFSPATDIYALGATLYKLLTGITPPDANLLMAKEETLASLPSCISMSTHNAVLKAMTLIRADRVQTVETFLSLLDSKTPDTSDNEETVCEEACKAAEEEQKRREGGTSSKTFTLSGVSFDMVKVQAGSFTMGATSEMEDPFNDEKPIHRVTLTNDYYIGKTEVTQALWRIVMGDNPSCIKGDNHPVENVTWYDCREFISRLNSMTGRDFRLPTEAEWEFAARGGNKSNHYQYSGSDKLGDVAWYDENSGGKTHPVATKLPNELGIYDMSGNVWEWCSDWFEYYDCISEINPTGPNNGTLHVLRGGGCDDEMWKCRSSYRDNTDPFNCGRDLGLRLVLVP